ncbi:MAG: dipeptide epimerase [Verrucomicrobia bacterium]|nr:MAG: dipeptide epimerase [Verrucomicrobiota bacterium]
MNAGHLALDAQEQSWPLDKPFRISRGARTEARVVVVTVTDGQHIGRGEAVPIRRYNQSPASVLAQIESIKSRQCLDRQQIQKLLPAGAARNALDCAFWDLEAKISGKRAWELANIPLAPEVKTSFTISLDTPAAMAAVAKVHATAPILKLKLGGDNPDLARVKAVREAAPAARLLIDANESWTSDHYCKVAPALCQFGIELIEQPFPADADEVLETLDHPIPVCADEGCHTTADLPRLKNRYEMVNIKLDKSGGLTEAMLLTERAREAGFKLLIGCMVCTSLGIAPARLLASAADYVDLDGPLLLAGDRHHAVSYDNGRIGIPSRELWG